MGARSGDDYDGQWADVDPGSREFSPSKWMMSRSDRSSARVGNGAGPRIRTMGFTHSSPNGQPGQRRARNGSLRVVQRWSAPAHSRCRPSARTLQIPGRTSVRRAGDSTPTETDEAEPMTTNRSYQSKPNLQTQSAHGTPIPDMYTHLRHVLEYSGWVLYDVDTCSCS